MNKAPQQLDQMEEAAEGFTRSQASWSGVASLTLVAVVLFAAATAKVLSYQSGAGLDAAMQGDRSAIILGVALLEVILGFALLSLSGHRFVLLCAICFFVATTMYGAWLLSHGQTQCPCFGDLPVSTLVSLVISLVCLCLLLGKLVSRESMSVLTRQRVRIVGFALAIAAVLAMASNAASDGKWFRSCTGLPIVVIKTEKPREGVDFLFGSEFDFAVTLKNSSATTARRILGSFGGFPSQVQDLPVVIQPSESKTIVVRARQNMTPPHLWQTMIEEDAKYLRNSGKTAQDTLTNVRLRMFLTTDDAHQPHVEIEVFVSANDNYIRKVEAALRGKKPIAQFEETPNTSEYQDK